MLNQTEVTVEETGGSVNACVAISGEVILERPVPVMVSTRFSSAIGSSGV